MTKDIISIEDRDPPEYHLAVLNQRIREMMNFVLRPFELKLAEWRILQCLQQFSTLTISDLSEMAVIERTVTSRLVDKLVSRGLAGKATLAKDRRAVQVVLTEEGVQLVEDCDAAVDAARRSLFAGLNQNEIAAFNAMLMKLQQNAVSVFRARGAADASLRPPRSG